MLASFKTSVVNTKTQTTKQKLEVQSVCSAPIHSTKIPPGPASRNQLLRFQLPADTDTFSHVMTANHH